MSFVSHVECTVCGRRRDAMRLLTVCEACGQMLARCAVNVQKPIHSARA